MISTFNTENTLKIWFSKPESPCLGPLNEWRLVSHRARFPEAEITLVINIPVLETERKHLMEFCEKWNVKVLDLKSIKDKILTDDSIEDKDIQLELLRIAELEIASDFGNLAAASDIIRILSPVAKIATYSDLDVIRCKMESAPSKVDSIFGIYVLGEISCDLNDKTLKLVLNNNLLACNERHTDFLKNYRAEVLKRYQRPKDILLALNAQKTFDIKEYAEARELFLKVSEKDKDLPTALRLRKSMHSKFKKENYEKALKALVTCVSGPSCLVDVMEEFINKKINPKIKLILAKKNIKPQDDVDRYIHAYNSMLMKLTWPDLKGIFENENDTSWLPSEDSTRGKLDKMQKSATIIQAAYRKHLARKSHRAMKGSHPLVMLSNAAQATSSANAISSLTSSALVAGSNVEQSVVCISSKQDLVKAKVSFLSDMPCAEQKDAKSLLESTSALSVSSQARKKSKKKKNKN